MISLHRLHLTDVTPAPHLPWARPTFPVFAYLVLHPDGPILIDTGVGIGNAFIDELYSPVHYDLDAALHRHGVEADDIAAVITSHLHFDHCGQTTGSTARASLCSTLRSKPRVRASTPCPSGRSLRASSSA